MRVYNVWHTVVRGCVSVTVRDNCVRLILILTSAAIRFSISAGAGILQEKYH